MASEPTYAPQAEANAHNPLAPSAGLDAKPLAISELDAGPHAGDPATLLSARTHARIEKATPASMAFPTVASVVTLLRRLFAARITDTIRPTNAHYGARHSWHKIGQAVDFVPRAGVTAIARNQIRAAMERNGIRILELLGPGDPGHSNHWHLAFARPGQVMDRVSPIERDGDWFINVASAAINPPAIGDEAAIAPASDSQAAGKAPSQWDVFAAADWRVADGGGS